MGTLLLFPHPRPGESAAPHTRPLSDTGWASSAGRMRQHFQRHPPAGVYHQRVQDNDNCARNIPQRQVSWKTAANDIVGHRARRKPVRPSHTMSVASGALRGC